MEKRPSIRWRSRDEKELARVTRNFNAKINRELNKHPEMKDILPDKINKKQLRENITTRQEFNKTVHSFERFLKKGAEETITSATGNTITKWEKREISKKVADINRQRTIERKRVEQMEALSRGKPIGLKRGEMGNTRVNELKPKKFDFDKIQPGKEWDKYVESVEKQSRAAYTDEKAELFKANYLKGLDTVFGSKADELKKIIQALPAQQIVDVFFADEEASIKFIYDPVEQAAHLAYLMEVWNYATGS
ncbi:MAG: hypothetical protein Q8876_07340 [Bacillota bacterium]|nr:hypothetical protein [Bacillota bacterium]